MKDDLFIFFFSLKLSFALENKLILYSHPSNKKKVIEQQQINKGVCASTCSNPASLCVISCVLQ